MGSHRKFIFHFNNSKLIFNFYRRDAKSTTTFLQNTDDIMSAASADQVAKTASKAADVSKKINTYLDK